MGHLNRLSLRRQLVWIETISDALRAGATVHRALILSMPWAAEERLTESLLAGHPLSATLGSVAKGWDPTLLALVTVGAQTGSLLPMLSRAHRLLQDRLQAQARLRRACAYPVFVLTFSVGIAAFLSRSVIPVLWQMYADSGLSPPVLTQRLVWMLDRLPGAVLIGAILLVLLWTFRRQLERAWPWPRPLRLWLGRSRQALYAETLGGLLSQGFLIYPCLEWLDHLAPIKGTFIPAQTALRAGHAPERVLIHVGLYRRIPDELTATTDHGQLGRALERWGLQRRETTARQADQRLSWLEPGMTVLAGIIVGLVLVALYIPLFEVSALAK